MHIDRKGDIGKQCHILDKISWTSTACSSLEILLIWVILSSTFQIKFYSNFYFQNVDYDCQPFFIYKSLC